MFSLSESNPLVYSSDRLIEISPFANLLYFSYTVGNTGPYLHASQGSGIITASSIAVLNPLM